MVTSSVDEKLSVTADSGMSRNAEMRPRDGRSRGPESRVWLRLWWRAREIMTDNITVEWDVQNLTQHPHYYRDQLWYDWIIVCYVLTPLCHGSAVFRRLTQVPTLHINSHSLTLYRHRHRQITGRLRSAMNRETNGNWDHIQSTLENELEEVLNICIIPLFHFHYPLLLPSLSRSLITILLGRRVWC